MPWPVDPGAPEPGPSCTYSKPRVKQGVVSEKDAGMSASPIEIKQPIERGLPANSTGITNHVVSCRHHRLFRAPAGPGLALSGGRPPHTSVLVDTSTLNASEAASWRVPAPEFIPLRMAAYPESDSKSTGEFHDRSPDTAAAAETQRRAMPRGDEKRDQYGQGPRAQTGRRGHIGPDAQQQRAAAIDPSRTPIRRFSAPKIALFRGSGASSALIGSWIGWVAARKATCGKLCGANRSRNWWP